MAAPLKYFHNLIKTRLIQRFAGDADKLLDLACGRGGDLYKWIRSGIKYVRGYDIAEREVRGPRAQMLESAEPLTVALLNIEPHGSSICRESTRHKVILRYLSHKILTFVVQYLAALLYSKLASVHATITVSVLIVTSQQSGLFQPGA
jgi:hypothetical protein